MIDFKQHLKKIYYIPGSAFAFIVAYIVYSFIVKSHVNTDVQSHAYAIIDMEYNKIDVPPNFLYFLVVYLFSGMSNDYYFVVRAAIMILAFSVALKYFVTANILTKNTISVKSEKQKKNTNIISATLIALLLMYIFSVPFSEFLENTNYFHGRFPPNLWHNSTTVFLFPFSILLFWKSWEIIENERANNFGVITILVILNLAIKPSFFFVYAMVFPLFLLHKYKISKRFLTYIIPICIGMLFLVLEFYFIYVLHSKYAQVSTEKSSLIISPFTVWHHYTYYGQMLPMFVSSCLLPITYFVFFPKELKEKLNQFVIAFLFVAILLYIFLAESGPRIYHGNFLWQTIICNYLLFMVVVINIINKIKQAAFRNNAGKIKLTFLSIVFLLHLFGGLLYIYRIFNLHSYH